MPATEDSTEVRPLVISRVLNALAWVAVAGLGIDGWLGIGLGRAGEVAGVAGCLVVGVCLAVRAYRAGVVLEPEAILVRGFFRSRRIPRAQVTEITEFPAVRWKRADGRARWSPIFVFLDELRTLPFIRRHNEASIQRLQAWNDRRRPAARRNPVKRRRRQR
jgi:hypothetical protein